MKSFIIALIMVMVSVSSSFANTIMWYLDINHERISYTVDIEKNIGTVEMVQFNNALKTILTNGNYSNITEMEDLVNRTATGDIRNFTVIDITVDEK